MSCVLSKLKKIIILCITVVLLLSMTNENKTVYSSNSKNHNQIALTFDDGPHPKITPKILDLLKEVESKTTIQRYRLGSLNPLEITPEMLGLNSILEPYLYYWA